MAMQTKDTDWKDVIWRYNMEQHLNIAYPEYAHPSKLVGLSLPEDMIPAVVLTSLEEKQLSVPVCPEFTLIAEK
ncbi:hypothetical protein PAXRUDRAFT_15523 [Paxillus rubicundulus Ve08.2h10]|uniref:Uncharacterized protein n=1 Tax=Paxillus rubicundulus Ve08.2h10 TaxID=930991 RepID=A0A0D0CE52_9AGAM|nr:hypothetical protein PAXRUDRAFT_15523 [Paxillus rubicundulus Ve08.2h10]